MQRFTRTVARNSAFGMATQLVIKILSFAFTILIVRTLGADSYGQYAAVVAFGAVFMFFSDLGLSPYVVREVARFRDQPDGQTRADDLYANMLALRLLLSLLTVIIIILVGWLTERPLIMLGALALNGLGLVMYGAQGSSSALLAGFERVDLASSANVILQIIFVVLGGIALWLGFGYYGLILANLVGIAVMTYFTWQRLAQLGVKPGRIAIRHWVPLLRAALPFGLIAFALGLSYKFDTFLLNITRGDAETGYYNAAYNLVFSTVVLSNVINTALYPSLAREAANKTTHLGEIYQRTLLYLLIMSLPVAVGVSLLADQLVPVLYKNGYLPTVSALQIVIWVVPLMFVSEFLGYIVLITDRERLAARALLVSTGVNVGLNLLLIPRYGYMAAAMMTVLTEAVLVGQYLWLLRHQLRELNWGLLVRPFAAAAVMGVVVYLLRGTPLFVNIILSGASYVILLIVLGLVGKSEVDFVIHLRRPAESAASK